MLVLEDEYGVCCRCGRLGGANLGRATSLSLSMSGSQRSSLAVAAGSCGAVPPFPLLVSPSVSSEYAATVLTLSRRRTRKMNSKRDARGVERWGSGIMFWACLRCGAAARWPAIPHHEKMATAAVIAALLGGNGARMILLCTTLLLAGVGALDHESVLFAPKRLPGGHLVAVVLSKSEAIPGGARR